MHQLLTYFRDKVPHYLTTFTVVVLYGSKSLELCIAEKTQKKRWLFVISLLFTHVYSLLHNAIVKHCNSVNTISLSPSSLYTVPHPSGQ